MRNKLMAEAGELFFAKLGLEQQVLQINTKLAQITQSINNLPDKCATEAQSLTKEPVDDAAHDTEQLGEDSQ